MEVEREVDEVKCISGVDSISVCLTNKLDVGLRKRQSLMILSFSLNWKWRCHILRLEKIERKLKTQFGIVGNVEVQTVEMM